jgi:hypothetical protein
MYVILTSYKQLKIGDDTLNHDEHLATDNLKPNHESPATIPGATPAATPAAAGPIPPTQPLEENPHKSYLLTLFLSVSFGWMGIDRVYLGKTGTAVAKLLTFGGLGIWALVDIVMTAFGGAHAKDDERPLKGYAENRDWVKIAVIFFAIFYALYFIFIGIVMTVSIIGGIREASDNTNGVRGLDRYEQQMENWPGQSDDYQLQ